VTTTITEPICGGGTTYQNITYQNFYPTSTVTSTFTDCSSGYVFTSTITSTTTAPGVTSSVPGVTTSVPGEISTITSCASGQNTVTTTTTSVSTSVVYIPIPILWNNITNTWNVDFNGTINDYVNQSQIVNVNISGNKSIDINISGNATWYFNVSGNATLNNNYYYPNGTNCTILTNATGPISIKNPIIQECHNTCKFILK
jgi:hypothetical protein